MRRSIRKKTDLVLFSRRRTGSILVGKVELLEVNLKLSPKVKYLGVTLHSRLNWIVHTEDKGRKTLAAFRICRTPSEESGVYRPKLSCGHAEWKRKRKFT